MSFLDVIIQHKREEIRRRKTAANLRTLVDRPLYTRRTFSLQEALSTKSLSVVAEIKKASPSKGIIRHDFDPVELAKGYVNNGAQALSILTDEKYFQGQLSFLEAVRGEVDLPILRKDFILDGYQLHEAKAYGADAVLLIARILTKNSLSRLLSEAKDIGLEVIIEVHDEDDLEKLPNELTLIIGVNNRNLETFETDIKISIRLSGLLPDGVVKVSESGITSAEDLRLLAEEGFDAVLIGESFMRAPDPGIELRLLLESFKTQEEKATT